VSPATVLLQFDPILRIGSLAVRLETLGLGLVLLIALLIAARIAAVERRRAELPGAPTDLQPLADLRLDDLLFLTLGAVPGAVIGGRLGSVLGHLDYYAAQPAAIVDPALGGLSLSVAILGGLISAAYVCRLLGASPGAWAHVVALPFLFAIGAAKLGLALGGTGQGLPADVGWATAYGGPGPWGSLGPEVPSHPAQLYEALAVLFVFVLVAGAQWLGAFARRDGSALAMAVALWAAARSAIGVTWRDPTVLGPLRVEQLLSIALALIAVLLTVIVRRRRDLALGSAASAGSALPEWPDPATRPRF
jgi:prolipoprotein diacylglyceryltransferase